MELSGEPDGPATKAGISIADEVAALYLVQGVLAALICRARTGRGRRIEVSLFDAMLSMFTYQAQQYLSAGVAPRRMGNAHPSLVPYRPFKAADRPIVVGVASDDLWQRFCRAVGRADLAKDPAYATNAGRVRRRDVLEEDLRGWFRAEAAGHWLGRLQAAGVPCGSIHTLPEALDGDAARVRQIVGRTDGTAMPYVRGPLRGLGEGAGGRRPPPRLGQHTTEVLTSLGYDAASLSSLRTRGVI
jgi:formyl-CoA transferase/CoA:oxalate CoA-transferase